MVWALVIVLNNFTFLYWDTMHQLSQSWSHLNRRKIFQLFKNNVTSCFLPAPPSYFKTMVGSRAFCGQKVSHPSITWRFISMDDRIFARWIIVWRQSPKLTAPVYQISPLDTDVGFPGWSKITECELSTTWPIPRTVCSSYSLKLELLYTLVMEGETLLYLAWWMLHNLLQDFHWNEGS